MRALVTGAGGFVGAYLCNELALSGFEVLACDHVFKPQAFDGKSDHINNRIIDVTLTQEIALIVSGFNPDVIYHLAAISSVVDADKDFEKVLKVNVAGTANFLEAAKKLSKKPKFIYISTGQIYDADHCPQSGFTESSAIKPVNKYALTKLMAEQLCNYYASTQNINTIIFRPFNHIGPTQSEKFVVASFAAQLARIKAGKAEPKLVVGNLNAKRDFTDVRDIVKAYVKAASKGAGIYNLASGQPVSISSILEKLIELSGCKIEIIQDQSLFRANDQPMLCGDASKAIQELDWRPQIKLDKSLQDTFNFFYQYESNK